MEDSVIEAVLRSELGRLAQFRRYERTHRTPMTLVLDEAERQLGPRFTIYWVDGGPPEVFCLPDLVPSPVAFSTRYLSLTAFVRPLFVEGALGGVLEDVAERTALKVMAELALRRGDPDYAALAFAKSLAGKGIFLNDDDRVMDLELEPIDEAYMATWFYGLAHELGHLHDEQARSYPDGHPFSDAGILEAISTALSTSFESYPEAFKREVTERATQRRTTSVIGIDQVRSEGLADFFATGVLFKATTDIMRELKGKPFEVQRFIAEMSLFLNIVATLERCRRVAALASATAFDQDAVLEIGIHPISVAVRMLMQRVYLDLAVTTYLFGDKPTPEQSAQASRLLNEINDTPARIRTIGAIDTGIARAMEFSLIPARRDNDWKLIEGLRRELAENAGRPEFVATTQLELERFCTLADSLGADGKLLRALQSLFKDPHKPIQSDPRGDLLFFIPWVKGPDGSGRPFGLDTKHGHLVFVFLDEDDLYELFFNASAEALAPGFTLTRAAVPVPRQERLVPELAAHMPAGKSFRIIIQNTEEFERYMRELADDTIWPV